MIYAMQKCSAHLDIEKSLDNKKMKNVKVLNMK